MIFRRRLAWFVVAVLVLAGLAACAGGGGGSQEEREELAAFVQQMASYNGAEVTPEDVDFYMAHITDASVQDFGGEDIAGCAADPEFCIGEPLPNASVSADNVFIDGDTATAVIDSEIGRFGIDLINEDGVWKANGTYVPDDEIAEGTEIVEVELIEFAFVGDLTSEAVQSGDFAFRFVNNGEQTHQAVLVALPAEGTIDELLSDERSSRSRSSSSPPTAPVSNPTPQYPMASRPVVMGWSVSSRTRPKVLKARRTLLRGWSPNSRSAKQAKLLRRALGRQHAVRP